ncbi:MAG: ABC transporter ATP-binding protein [Actinomycetota bacterium]|nr:ABC transporter ATP-binding protein [Actinomycetota bacterium]
MTATIETGGLGKDFGPVRALDALDLRVAAGEFFGLLGPNGAGKTTTINLLATLAVPTRGWARVAGHDVSAEPLAVRRRIGLVFQTTTLDLALTAEENLRFVARLYGLNRRAAAHRAREALELFDLADRRGDVVRGFSGGMRRALDVARAVMHRPAVLFLDEPTSGLDPVQRRRVWQLLRRLREEVGTTILLTTHRLEEADPCDHVAFLDGGRMIASGSPQELKRGLGEQLVEVEGAADEEAVGVALQRLSGRYGNDGAVLWAPLPAHSVDLEAVREAAGPQARVTVRAVTLEDVFVALAARPELQSVSP